MKQQQGVVEDRDDEETKEGNKEDWAKSAVYHGPPDLFISFQPDRSRRGRHTSKRHTSYPKALFGVPNFHNQHAGVI